MGNSLPRIVLLAGALVLTGSAGACTSDSTGPSSDLPEPGDSIIVAFDQPLDRWPRSPWDLLDAAVHDTVLHLSVAYSGGCRDHDFWLLAVRGFLTLPDAGVTPTVAVPLLVAHDAHYDTCEAHINEGLDFDIGPLRVAFEAQFGAGPARILLLVPVGQGTVDTTTVNFTFE